MQHHGQDQADGLAQVDMAGGLYRVRYGGGLGQVPGHGVDVVVAFGGQGNAATVQERCTISATPGLVLQSRFHLECCCKRCA
jgi:hypothetical protein